MRVDDSDLVILHDLEFRSSKCVELTQLKCPGRASLVRGIFHSLHILSCMEVYNRFMLTRGDATFMDPRAVITHFHLRQGDAVADFGAGVGHYLGELSRAVGTQGSVHACEIQKSLVERLTERIHTERLSNVHALWCDLEAPGGIKLRDGLLDAGMLINTLFQIEDRTSALREIARVIRKGGKLLLVDWSDSFGGIGPQPSQVLKEDVAKKILLEAGFEFERDFPAANHHYGLAFRRL